jgi:hypothetical protein
MPDITPTPVPTPVPAPAPALTPAPAPAPAPASASSALDKLLKKILDAVEDLTTLKVVTAVGDVTITETAKKVDGNDEQSRTQQCLNAKAIVTTIDLADGDIQTFMDGVFASDNAAYNKIRDEHMLRIKDAHDIVGNNVKVLKELVNTISAILATSTTTSRTKTVNLRTE